MEKSSEALVFIDPIGELLAKGKFAQDNGRVFMITVRCEGIRKSKKSTLQFYGKCLKSKFLKKFD